MLKRLLSCAAVALLAVTALSLTSCASGSQSSTANAPKQVKYHCLSSSCDAVTVCNEGDPVPTHCGKPMIR